MIELISVYYLIPNFPFQNILHLILSKVDHLIQNFQDFNSFRIFTNVKLIYNFFPYSVSFSLEYALPLRQYS